MIKVLLASDMRLIRGALAALLDQEPDIKLVEEVPNDDRVVSRALAGTPDVAVIDIDLPGKGGLTTAEDLRQQLPSCRILILTSVCHPGTVRRALDFGVRGFLLKDAEPAGFAQAVREVAAGHRVVDSGLALAAWEARGLCPLGRRELEILRHVAAGLSVADIAAALSLATGTVRNHLASVVHKLQARTRVDAILIAQDSGWL